MNNSTKIEETKEYLYCLYKAKNTLWYFNELINNKTSNYTAVKFKNKDNFFVWLENVIIEDSYYSGVLSENNSPQKVLISDAIDWMVIESGRLIGGYTIRHYRDTLDDEAKLNFDIDFGVKIDEGNDFFKPDSSTPEGAIITIENFYTDENLEGVLSCKNFFMEAENLLKEREALITEDILNEIEESLRLNFIEDLKVNGFPSFRNIGRSFTLKQKKEDLQLIEEKVIYSNGNITFNVLWIGFSDSGEWKVLDIVD
jgi:uncharacterized protein YegJ (DUF2314 family)